MPRLGTFWAKAMTGYAAVTVLLAGGMAVTIRRLAAVGEEQLALLHAEEKEITLAERLRWSGELIVSIGRGYLISGNSDLLTRLRGAEAELDARVRALQSMSLNSTGVELVAGVEREVRAFRRVQRRLLEARARPEDAQALASRFDQELRPVRLELARALDRLVEHKERTLREAYDRSARDRARLTARMHGLLGVLVLIGLAIASLSARLLLKAYRDERDALESARKALAARDELIGVVAHDLRNPLAAIVMKAGVLRSGAESDRARRQAESIESVAARMEHLIGRLLDLATIEAGRFQVAPEPCAVDYLLKETRRLYESLAAPRGVRLVCAAAPGLVVNADRERALQVLSNLVGNALKFAPDGGLVEVTAARNGDAISFAVADDGPGIPAAHVAHLFDRFWTHETGSKTGSGTGIKPGTGLGLFIAKGIVEAHGGLIRAENGARGGAVFTFTLPRSEGQPAAGRGAEAGAAGGRR